MTHRQTSVRSLRSTGRRLLVPAALVLSVFALGGCKLPTFGQFNGATTQAQTENKLWSQLVILGIGVGLIVFVLILWAAVRYRRSSKNSEIPKQFSENVPLEIFYTIIPCILVGLIFWGTVVAENTVDTVVAHPAEIVNVTAYRWGWRFSYASSNGVSQHVMVQTSATPALYAKPATSSEYPQLMLPSNSTVRIVLQSVDVIHGFYIPAFEFSRYAQPGVINTFDFTTTSTGNFRGQCNEYCGLYHAEMLFSVKVVSPATFTSWLTSHAS